MIPFLLQKILHPKTYFWLKINALGRKLSKYNIHDKRKGSEKEHVWSGVMLRTTDTA
jgi:hypothetical protein